MNARVLPILGALLVLAACAANRMEMDVRAPAVPNPAAGQAFRLTVVDTRSFAAGPRGRSAPSLGDGAEADAAIAPRAFARKPGADGASSVSLLLPEGRTAAQVTRDALAAALREQGYRVVSDGDPDYAAARPLSAEMQQFWAWMEVVPPEPVALYYYECDIRVHLTGDWPLADNGERDLRGDEWVFHGDARDDHWRGIVEESLGELIYVLKVTSKKAAGG